MRAPSSVIFDVVATRTSCPLPGPPHINGTIGQHQPVPQRDGKCISTLPKL
jgi:hypothetical protein